MDNNRNNDLVFNVAQLLKERVGSTRRLKLGSLSLTLYAENEGEQGTLEASDLTGEVKVTRLSDGVLVQGDVEADVHLQCSRCLEDITLPVDARLEEQFQPTVDVETGKAIAKVQSDEDDTSFTIDSNHLMDLTEPVRQALLVALPMRPLCREDCKGLCAVCGENLNYVDCGHTQDVEDNRWDALRALNIADFPVDKNAN